MSVIRLAARRLIPLHYVSAVAILPIMGASVPASLDENTPLHHGEVLYSGYAQSKWVAEALVADAQARGLPGAIYRPGLIVGHSRTGAWNAGNIIANMLQSWVELGMAPEIFARLDLAPVDYVSSAIVRLMLPERSTPSDGLHVYHVNSPYTVPVPDLIRWLSESGYSIRTMPYPAWRSAMLAQGVKSRQAALRALGPLLALDISEDVDWLERIPVIENRRTRQALGDLVCPPVNESTFLAYVQFLQHIGALPLADVDGTTGRADRVL